MQKTIRPKKKKLCGQHGVWTTATFENRIKSLVFHERTDKKEKYTSESMGNSCQNSHKREKRGGENDDVEKK